MRTPRLTDEQIRAALAARIPEWSYEAGALRRVFHTGAWARSMALAAAIGDAAEAADHHPDLLVTYPRLEATLTSHDAGGVTERDLALAEQIDRLADPR